MPPASPAVNLRSFLARRLGRRLQKWLRVAQVLAPVLLIGYLLPENGVLPVQGATVADWDPASFWYEPWGVSGVHKGIDIFAARGTPSVAAVAGIVTYAGTLSLGGNVVLILGPRWRLHYYAHMETISVQPGQAVRRGQPLGTVGDSGNARGKPPHLHYAIRTPFPIPWLFKSGTQGWKRMFYLDPVSRFHAWGAL